MRGDRLPPGQHPPGAGRQAEVRVRPPDVDDDFGAKETKPVEVSPQGIQGEGRTADLSPFTPGMVPVTLFISDTSATAELAGHKFKGLVIGTLAEDPAGN